MPAAPAKEPAIRGRAFDVARWWITLLASHGVTVAPRGTNQPLAGIASLLTGKLRVYTDEQVKDALRELNEPWPTASALERTLVRRSNPTGGVGTGSQRRTGRSGAQDRATSRDKWAAYERERRENRQAVGQ